MSPEIMIQAENLGKKFMISHERTGRNYLTLRDLMAKGLNSLAKRAIAPARRPERQDLPEKEEFWALCDLAFTINQGDRVGIIGLNGSGKSTLLKILSRITEPSTGRVRVKGRMASLLEVGTGFHPELSGRENIFLNGAILGMSRTEIRKKFDEIVDFAEVEKFLDTPVKRYSSGMYVRLAFSVVAHMEPDVLLVDEVLAVGDAAFQKKCLGKMEDAGRKGRTILFVSHNSAAVRRLCNRALWLSSGRLAMDGPTEETLSAYLRHKDPMSQEASAVEFEGPGAPGDDFTRLRRVCLTRDDGKERAAFRLDQPFSLLVDFQILQPFENFHLYAKIHNDEGIQILASADWDQSGDIVPVPRDPGMYRARLDFPPHLLNAGVHMVSLYGFVPAVGYVFQQSPILSFILSNEGGAGGSEDLNRPGLVRPVLAWSEERIGSGRD